MKRYTQLCLALFLIVLLTGSVSCTKKVKKDSGLTESTSEKKLGEEGLEEAHPGGPKWNEPTAAMAAYFQDIHFDYDRFDLRADAKTALNKMGEWLLKNTSTQVLIEGHCDDRGNAEYNLALGERRAHSAQKYLSQLGVNPDRISTISYGKERPVDPSRTESAYAKNRRDHFLYR